MIKSSVQLFDTGHVRMEARDRVIECIDWFQTENRERAARDIFRANSLFFSYFLGHKFNMFNAVSEYIAEHVLNSVKSRMGAGYRGTGLLYKRPFSSGRAHFCEHI